MTDRILTENRDGVLVLTYSNEKTEKLEASALAWFDNMQNLEQIQKYFWNQVSSAMRGTGGSRTDETDGNAEGEGK